MADVHYGSAHHTQSHAVTSTSDHSSGNWKVLYTNGSGQVIELALGAANTVLQSAGATSAPTFATPTTAAHGASVHDDRTRRLIYAPGGGVDTVGGPITVGTISAGSIGTGIFNCLDAADDGMSWNDIMPSDMVAGTPTAVLLWYSPTSHASNYAVLFNALELAAGASFPATGTSTDTTIPGGSTTTIQRTTIAFPIATLAPDDVFRIAFERNASTDSANDTATAAMRILGLELSYTADM